MNNAKKNLIYSVLLLTSMAAVYLYRQYAHTPLVHLTGTTMGVVPYSIKYLDKSGQALQPSVDSLLEAFNQSLSTYIPNSEISTFNKDSAGFTFESPFFYPVLHRSAEIFNATDGMFDPTVMPLVKAWGFGPGKAPENLDSAQVDSIRQFVGFKKISFDGRSVSKSAPGVQLDFSAIAKGYGVDVVAELLLSRGIQNFMVEIGGEIVCRGNNPSGKPWVIGIDNPLFGEPGQEAMAAKVKMEDRAVATSGNYRNFYIKDGKKYAHTLHPKTGYPVEHSLLSASVFAPDCMTADAFATALMVMGTEEAIRLLETRPELEGLLIYEEGGQLRTYATAGLKESIIP